MTYSYESYFAENIINFIKQKNSVGFSYQYSKKILKNFDSFCMENFPNETQLTKELCLAWAVKKDTENNNSFNNRLMPIREFARFLNRIGREAYVIPTRFVKKESAHAPYIYSENEIKSIWDYADNLPHYKNFPIRHFVIPTALRILYCCGLRPSEIRKLQVSDVDLEKGHLFIRESKRHKSRTVIMTDDVTEICRQYASKASVFVPNREYFFSNSTGGMYSKEWFDDTFKDIRNAVGIVGFQGCTPRLYDFRHTFATHRLYRWMKEGKNLNVMLPYLSAYMGHEQLSDTYYYIHLIPDMLEHMSRFDFSTLEHLIPEVTSYE